jgi:hypothetical protein
MGNRGGALHNDQREIVRAYASRRWIACVLEFRGRRRTVMSPGRYTELFFLDEVVALAAGHRPCAECRRADFNAFKDAWGRARGLDTAASVRADDMDLELHRARMGARRTKVTYEAALDSLPEGCFVRLESASCLIWHGALWRWSPEGYREEKRTAGDRVTVLTPEPMVECLMHGYRPVVHSSAAGDLR